MRRILALAAVSGLFFTAGAGPALAAHTSEAHEQHQRIAQESWPGDGWDQMGSNPSDMDGMMCSPPMHGAEHPGPGDPPSVTTVVGDQDDDELSACQ